MGICISDQSQRPGTGGFTDGFFDLKFTQSSAEPIFVGRVVSQCRFGSAVRFPRHQGSATSTALAPALAGYPLPFWNRTHRGPMQVTRPQGTLCVLAKFWLPWPQRCWPHRDSCSLGHQPPQPIRSGTSPSVEKVQTLHVRCQILLLWPQGGRYGHHRGSSGPTTAKVVTYAPGLSRGRETRHLSPLRSATASPLSPTQATCSSAAAMR